MRHAVQLYEAGVAPRIVMTGGVGDHAPSEARASATLAEQLGVPADACRQDRQSDRHRLQQSERNSLCPGR